MKTIEIISIPVTDQARAKEFYQKLGFELGIEAPFGTDNYMSYNMDDRKELWNWQTNVINETNKIV